MTIVDALRDADLFGRLPAFRDLTSWWRWGVFLKALYGLALDAAEEALFCLHTGRTGYVARPGGYREAACVVGRQSGKSKIASLIVAFEAMRAAPDADGTDLYAVAVSQDHRAALRTLLSYASTPFESLPALARMVLSRTTDTLKLASGVTLAAYPCRPAAVRGLRAVVAVADELAFFRSAEGNPQDVEMLRALRPCLATTGGRLIILSSPYGQAGELWRLYSQHYGKDEASTLVWRASAPEMNPTLPSDYLERMAEDDPEAYRSEVLGEFRSGLASLFDPDALEAVVDRGVRERLPSGGSGAAVATKAPAVGTANDDDEED